MFYALTGIAFPQDFNNLKINDFKKLNSITKNVNPIDSKKVKQKDISFTINPYLWLIAAGGTLSIPNIPSGYPQYYDFSKSVSDGLKNMKFAFMVGGKLKYKKVSFYYDVVYINLKNFGATVPEGSGLNSANTTNKEFITDLSIGYDVHKGKTSFVDLYAGARIWALKSEITLIPSDKGLSNEMLSSNSSWVDPIVGVNAKFLMGKKWFSYIRSDFGGFGVSSSWNFMMLGGFGYDLNPNWNTTLGLKYLGLDYDKDKTRWNVNQYGILISLGYRY